LGKGGRKPRASHYVLRGDDGFRPALARLSYASRSVWACHPHIEKNFTPLTGVRGRPARPLMDSGKMKNRAQIIQAVEDIYSQVISAYCVSDDEIAAVKDEMKEVLTWIESIVPAPSPCCVRCGATTLITKLYDGKWLCNRCEAV
jgi:ribosomal protein S27AE